MLVADAVAEFNRIVALRNACESALQRAVLSAEVHLAMANLAVVRAIASRNKCVASSDEWAVWNSEARAAQAEARAAEARAAQAEARAAQAEARAAQAKVRAAQAEVRAAQADALVERAGPALDRAWSRLQKRDFILARLNSLNNSADGVSIPIKERPGVWDERMKLADWSLGGETHERSEAITDAINYIHGRSSFEIGRPGIAATWAAPGTGKTHFLDALALHIASSGDMPDHIVLPVTFNGVASRGTGDLHHLLCNILYSYFVGRLQTVDVRFFSKAMTVLSLELEFDVVLDIILADYHERHPTATEITLVLLIDEISKSKDVAGVYRAASNCVCTNAETGMSGVTLTTRVVFTSLDFSTIAHGPPVPGSTNTSLTGSNRPLQWCLLPLLAWRPEAKEPLVRRLLAMAAGHARTMQWVREGALSKDFHNAMLLPGADFGASLCAYVTKQWTTNLRILPTAFRGFVAPALIGVSMRYDAQVENHTFAQAVVCGALINTDATKTRAGVVEAAHESAVPTISVFLLACVGGDDCNALVNCLCAYDLSGAAYERLHALWETVVRRLYFENRVLYGCETLTLLSDATAPVVGDMALYRGVMLFGARRVHVRASAARSVLSLAEKLSDADVCEWHELATSAMVDAIAVGQTVVPGKSNVAFDLATLFETAEGGRHLLLVECKYSAPESGTTLQQSDVVPKLANLQSLLPAMLANPQHLFVRSGISRPEQVSFLIVPMRDATGVLAGQVSTWVVGSRPAFDVGLLSRDALLELYGPSLRGAMVFVRETSEE
jgi:hypothetical protein